MGNVGKDSAAWQLRAHRLIGSRTGFPVGPREDFDWPSACLEMEQLISGWTGQARLVARQTQEDEEAREQVRLQDREPVAEAHEDGREDGVEGVGVEAQEVAYDADEEMEVAMDGDEDEYSDEEDEVFVRRDRDNDEADKPLIKRRKKVR